MTALLPLIRDLIRQNGAMPVADYMRMALQHPQHGYYRHGDPLGQGGDFVTAPEISQMFGEMIGLWCAEIWRHMGEPQEFILLELGPGRGTLMHDALRATGKLAEFQAALELHLLESSATLWAQQQEKLGPHHPHYIDGLSQLPALPVIAIANEFFDALPIRQFEKTFNGWCERLVTENDGKLSFVLSPPDEAINLLIPEAMRNANPGIVHEVSPTGVNMMRDLARHIAMQGGAVLVIDYGYADADGKTTFQAVAKHAFTDPLGAPGEADLTALVNFGMLGAAAATQGAVVHGAIGQGEFLNALGISLRAEQLKLRANDKQKADIGKALLRLTDAAEMGVLFKAMAVTSPDLKQLPGF